MMGTIQEPQDEEQYIKNTDAYPNGSNRRQAQTEQSSKQRDIVQQRRRKRNSRSDDHRKSCVF